MFDYAGLLQKAAEASQQMASIRSGQKSAVVEVIKRLMADFDLTVSDINRPSESSPPRKKPRRSPTPKYQDDKGRQWAGRGLPPKWVKDALASGKTLEDLLIKKDAS